MCSINPEVGDPLRPAAPLELIDSVRWGEGLRITGREQRNGTPGAPLYLALTFDDGHLETYTEAYPLLARRDLTATVYVVTGLVSTSAWFEPGGRPMNWSMIRELHAAGWTIGSHTVRHPRLTEVGDELLCQELYASRAALEDALGSPCRHFCAPYGAMDQRVLDAARAAGYTSAALSLPARFKFRDPSMVLLRSGVYPATSWWRFRLKARGWDQTLRGGSLKKSLKMTSEVD